MPAKKAPKRQKEVEAEDSAALKKLKVSHKSHGQEKGLVLVLGQGDVGQLGLGEDVLERKKPALVNLPEGIVQAVAGGMHTVCLSDTGNVYTFGCNDEGALGRDTSEEGTEMVPAKVELAEKIVQVSAGDSHTAALTEEGTVFVWGSFRDNNGIIGLLEPMKKCTVPTKVPLDKAVIKIASGNDHLVMLTVNGEIYTSGCGEQGQLGRVPERFANRGGRKGLSMCYLYFNDCEQNIKMPVALPNMFVYNQFSLLGTSVTEEIILFFFMLLIFESMHYFSVLTSILSLLGSVFAWGMGTNLQLGTGEEEDLWSPVEMSGKQLENRVVLSASSGGQHTVLLVKDKQES
uniref:Regulator of chromosome condensation 1 n=1 Tax=Astyanax mexicanus TaxID=7994 RepID=A0A3B1J4J0_ASTMX